MYIVKLDNGLVIWASRRKIVILLEKKDLLRGPLFEENYILGKDIKVHPTKGYLGVIRRIKGKNRFFRLKDLNLREVVFDIEDPKVKEEIMRSWKDLRFSKSLNILADRVEVFSGGKVVVEGKEYWKAGVWDTFQRKIMLNERLIGKKRWLKETLAHEVGHSLLDNLEFGLFRVEQLRRLAIKRNKYSWFKLSEKVGYNRMLDTYEWWVGSAALQSFKKDYTRLSEKQLAKLVEMLANDVGRYLRRKKTIYPLTPVVTRDALVWLHRLHRLLVRAR